jgi:hypothetical protein
MKKKKSGIAIQPTKVRDIKSSWKRNGLRKTRTASTGILWGSQETLAYDLFDGIAQPHRRQFVFLHPSDIADVASCFGFSRDSTAKIID